MEQVVAARSSDENKCLPIRFAAVHVVFDIIEDINRLQADGRECCFFVRGKTLFWVPEAIAKPQGCSVVNVFQLLLPTVVGHLANIIRMEARCNGISVAWAHSSTSSDSEEIRKERNGHDAEAADTGRLPQADAEGRGQIDGPDEG